MTIRIIEQPSRGESWWHISTNVRKVEECRIIRHDGTVEHKNWGAKVEILSLIDAPEDWEGRKAFYSQLNGYTEADWLKSPFEGYYGRMTEARFEALEFPTHY